MIIGNLISNMTISAPHLRDLTFLEKPFEQNWAKNRADLGVKIKEEVDKTEPQRNQLPGSQLISFERQDDEIVNDGFQANPRAKPSEKEKIKPRGRSKPTPPVN